MRTPTLIQYVRRDLERYNERTNHRSVYTFFWNSCFQAVLVYRLSHWIKELQRHYPSPILIPLHIFEAIGRRVTEIITHIYIDPNATIGPGLYIAHGFGVIIGPAEIGSNCDIYQEVTIGQGAPWNQNNIPRIGDRVYLGPGAKIFGHIDIGNDAVVGANTVVVKSIPDRGIVQPFFGRQVSWKGSFDLVEYPDMENDPDRIESLRLRDLENVQPADNHVEKVQV